MQKFLSTKYLFQWVLIDIFAIFLVFVAVATKPPEKFPNKIQVHIEEGSSLSAITNLLYKKKIIRSPFLFKALSFTIDHVLNRRASINAGDYLFTGPENLLSVLYRVEKGVTGLPKLRITVFEGSTSYDVAWILLQSMPNFDAPYFVRIAKEHEGYLFPDTYFFYSNVSPKEVLSAMLSNFDKKVRVLPEVAKMSEDKLNDLIILASIVEEEANNFEDRKIVAGILENRLAKGSPLQLDTPFWYLLSKGSLQLTQKDLAIDSPYNTYKHKGLPPTPISNPGIEAIRASLSPADTSYMFFLTGKDGMMHYSETFQGHVENKKKYL